MRPTRIEEPQHGEFVNMPALRALTAGDVIRLRDFYDANGDVVFVSNRNRMVNTTTTTTTTKSSTSGNDNGSLSR
jgi:hypothetical protein